MFDPLNSTANAFADDDSLQPPWPTTPHEPNSPIPNLRRAPSAVSSVTSTPQMQNDGLYGKEPKIYGQPEPGLVSPRITTGSNGNTYEKLEPYLRVRFTGLDRNRRDILFKFDAQTNLSNFTGTTYRNVSRSYTEFQQFYDALINNCPHTIIPALPLAQSSAPTDEEDDRLVRIMLQRWFTRICEDPIIINDEDLRSFIESDFGYQPTLRPRRKMSSGFSLVRRNIPDEDEELQRARFELTKLETQFFDAAKAIDKMAIVRKALSTTHSEMGNKLINVATTESHPPLANAFRKFGRTWHSIADLDQAQAISECVLIGDTLGYQGMNAKSAKETLQQRTAVLEEYQTAVKTTISKRRNIERLKASANIRPDKVDEAIEDMEEANKYEQVLAKRADGISQNLHRALQTHNRLMTEDIAAALVEHARSSLMYEKQLLRELESLRSDVNNASKRVLEKTNGVPQPTIVPPLHADPSAPSPSRTGIGASPAPKSTNGPLAVNSVTPSSLTFRGEQDSGPPPQSPGAGPSSFGVSQQRSPGVPPLGGQTFDGTKSMFVTPSPLGAGAAAVTSSPLAQGPLSPTHPLGRSATSPTFGLPPPSSSKGHPAQRQILDPLGQTNPSYMSQSVRVQPTRPRLDAREAASKLANMF